MKTTTGAGRFRFLYRAYAPGTTMAPHCDGEARVSIVVWGGLRETTVTREETATSASVVVKPGSTRHANEFGAQGAGVVSIVPERPDPDAWRERYGWIHAGPVAAASTRLVAALRNAQPGSELDARAVELLALLDGHTEPAMKRAPSWLERIHRRVMDGVSAPVSVRSLAREAGVHPVYLTRLFRRHYGLSIRACLRRLRVRAAADVLASSDLPFSRVALDTGFSDQSHLCRIFKSEMGVSPGRYRGIMAPRGFDSFNT